MNKQVVKVLDTIVGEEGLVQYTNYVRLKEREPNRFTISNAGGSVIQLQGKAEDTDDWGVYHEFTDSTPADVWLPAIWRAARISGSGDVVVKLINVYNENILDHE